MKQGLRIAMVTASLSGGASVATAQSTIPADLAPAPNSTVVVTPSGGALYYHFDVSPFDSGEQTRDHEAGRSACDARPLFERTACFDGLNARFSSQDATCAKFSGSALDACRRGADHGG